MPGQDSPRDTSGRTRVIVAAAAAAVVAAVVAVVLPLLRDLAPEPASAAPSRTAVAAPPAPSPTPTPTPSPSSTPTPAPSPSPSPTNPYPEVVEQIRAVPGVADAGSSGHPGAPRFDVYLAEPLPAPAVAGAIADQVLAVIVGAGLGQSANLRVMAGGIRDDATLDVSLLYTDDYFPAAKQHDGSAVAAAVALLAVDGGEVTRVRTDFDGTRVTVRTATGARSVVAAARELDHPVQDVHIGPGAGGFTNWPEGRMPAPEVMDVLVELYAVEGVRTIWLVRHAPTLESTYLTLELETESDVAQLVGLLAAADYADRVGVPMRYFVVGPSSPPVEGQVGSGR